ncbi:lymphocyte antigen 6D-like [Epinephelus moara]|uniref:lymphocyte antigen 6D-like n=1 Tax=Epinephelus moara TaxID=300413 RepID=UPI00214F4AC0|nr:lymphocyte antigen 6D-like [Epinephelus moara]
MQWFGALILFVTLSAAFGLKCHICQGETCTNPQTCPPTADRCAITKVNNAVAKTCTISGGCAGATQCCETDLCNSAIPTGSSVLLLLVSSSIITLFL